MCRHLTLDEYDGNFDFLDAEVFDVFLDDTKQRNEDQQKINDINWLYDLDDLYN